MSGKKGERFGRASSVWWAVAVAGIVAIAAVLIPATLVSLYIVDVYEGDVGPRATAFGGIAFIVLLCIAVAAATLVAARWFFVLPLRDVMRGMRRLAEGDFSVRVDEERAWTPAGVRDFMRSFNVAAAELGSVELLRRDFTDSFSHEFKTPIVSISGFARLLRDADAAEEQRREWAGIIVEEADRLANLAGDVLALARAESQEILADAVECDIAESVRRAVLVVGAKWERKNVDMEIDVEEACMRCDASMLERVWVNLLDNAVKFSPEGGCVQVSLHGFPDAIVFAVSDGGPGMDEAVQRRIFERFYQADSSHATKGNGLGLPMAKRIAELHGGTVQVESIPGNGATFTVILPRK